MFLNPNNNAIADRIAYFGLRTISQPIRNTRTSIKKTGNTRPRKVMNHQFFGSRKGARQERRKKITTITLATKNNRLVKTRSLLDIPQFNKTSIDGRICDCRLQISD